MNTRYFDGETFTRSGLTFRVCFPYDDVNEPPWDREDGHGVVSDWTNRDKRSGERVLCSDRGSKRFYDVAESTRIARRDGWNAKPYGGTRGQRAARAVDADFKHLRRWCNDNWCYVGVVIERLDANGRCTRESDALWGIKSDCTDYLAEVAHEMRCVSR